MLGLYMQEQKAVQNLFNFYIALVTLIIGMIIFILQTIDILASRLVSSGLLIFVIMITAVYLTILSGKYAQISRYAYTVDELRRFLINQSNIPTPPHYESFIQTRIPSTRPTARWYHWLWATGMYQMLMGLINGFALVGVLLLISSLAPVNVTSLTFGAVLIFFLAVMVTNIYSRWVLRRTGRSANLYLWGDSRV